MRILLYFVKIAKFNFIKFEKVMIKAKTTQPNIKSGGKWYIKHPRRRRYPAKLLPVLFQLSLIYFDAVYSYERELFYLIT